MEGRSEEEFTGGGIQGWKGAEQGRMERLIGDGRFELAGCS